MAEDFAAIIDTGSAKIKAGFSGEEAPRCRLSNVKGMVKGEVSMAGAA